MSALVSVCGSRGSAAPAPVLRNEGLTGEAGQVRPNESRMNGRASRKIFSTCRFLHPCLFVLCLLAGGAGLAWGQSLLDAAWLAVATPAEVHALLERGADVAAQTPDGLTPLHVAAAGNSRLAVVELLLERGADVAARDMIGGTPLHWAARRGRPAAVGLLLERGADVAAQTTGGGTPLHWAAAQNPTPAVVELLLEWGADATAQDAAGETPVDLAAENLALTGTAAYRRLQTARF